MKSLILALACATAGLCTSQVAAQNEFASTATSRITATIDDSERVPLKGNIHPLARREFDLGPAAASTPTGRLKLVLQRSEGQQQALTQYLADVQNPASASYHRWLTPQEYGARFGVSDTDLVAVEDWLQSHGFTIEGVPPAHNVLEFSGTVSQLQSAFRTAIHTFSVHGQSHFANATEPSIPSALAPVIAGVGPLNNFRPRPMMVQGPQGRFDASTGRISPELTLSGNGKSYLFVDPADAAIIYNVPNSALNPGYTGTSYDGTGVSIGIVGVSDLTTADVANYRIAFLGETSGSVNLPTVIVDGNDPGINGAGTEALLDTEIAGGIAPKAKLYFYTSADTDLSSGLVNAIYRALDDNKVSILSISFGECESALGTSGNQLIREAAEQAAAQGISLTVSSGDSGSAGCDDFDTQAQATRGFAVNGFASSPYAIAVGGTDFDVLSSSFATYVNNTTSGTPPYYGTALKYIPESPWNDSTTINNGYSTNIPTKDSQGYGNIVAGSGGPSSVYAKPPYQSSLTPQDGFRDLPDVSLLAGNGLYNAAWVLCSDNVTDGASSGYVECQTTNGQFTSNTVFGGVGGTSASAPAFAGMLALVAQAHGSASDNYRLGQANNILYQLAKSKYSTVFHDVASGNNSVACASGSPNCGSNGFLTGYNAATGYDLASGLGSVDAAAMVNNWTSVSVAPTTTTLKINGSSAAYTGVHGQPLTLDVSVSPTSASGTVAVVDNANESTGGKARDGQLAIAINAGSGSATYNGMPGGSYNVWARYGGDVSNASSISTPPINITITPEDSITTLAAHAYDRKTGQPISTTDMPLGSYVVLDAQVQGKAEGANTQGVATGNVTFNDGMTNLGIQPISSGNLASWPALTGRLPVLSGGQHQLVASYSGDSSFNASVAAPVTVSVLRGASRVGTSQAVQPLNSTQSDFVTVTIYTDNFGTAPPEGTVTLTRNGTPVASGGVGGGYGTVNQWIINGMIPVKGSQFQPGLNNLAVQYSGDSNYQPSAGGPVYIDAIAPGGGVSLTMPDTISLTAGTSVTMPVTLTPSGGYTGTTRWSCDAGSNNNILLCMVPQTHVPLSAPVDTVFDVFANSSTPAGSYTVRLKGDDGTTDGISITKNITLNVTAAPPALTLIKNGVLNVTAGATTGNASAFTVIPSGGLTGQVSLTCAITASLSNPQSAPTCTVPASLTLNGGSPVMSQVLVGTTAATSTGAYSVTITATSASNSAATASMTVPLIVTASSSFSLSTSGVVNILVGKSISNAATLTINPLNGFSGSVNVACSVQAAFLAAGTSIPTCTVPSAVTLASGSPANINVGLDTPVQNFGGFYLLTLSVVDPNSLQLGFDASVDVMMGVPFTISNSGNIQLTAGATTGNSSTITVTPSGGFTGGVNLTCIVTSTVPNIPKMPSCSLSPPALNITGTTAVTSTLSITTLKPSAAGSQGPISFRVGAFTTVLAAAFLFIVPGKHRNKLRVMGVLVLVAGLGLVSCGGGGGGSGSGSGTSSGSGTPGTTPGNYSVVVTATDAATGKLVIQTSVALTVN